MVTFLVCFWWLDDEWTMNDTVISICAVMAGTFAYTTTNSILFAIVAGVFVVVCIFLMWLFWFFEP